MTLLKSRVFVDIIKMSSYRIWVGCRPNDSTLIRRLYEDTNTKRSKKAMDDGGRGWSEAAASQGH